VSDTMTQTESATDRVGAGSLLDQVIARFREQNPGFLIGDDVIRRYHLAMQSRGFVILSGASGTGKTWLAQAYADAIGARPKLAAVDPSWSSNEDLLGYLSPLDGFYHHTPFSEFVQEAAREWTSADLAARTAREFHVILDEMNLARVEHYFSRFLSAMEVRSREGIARLDLAPGHTVELTPNLRFAGTVNIDETTHGFADKVYDRAQLLELPLQRSYVEEYLQGEPYAEVLLRVWDALRPIAPFGFRVLEEMHHYVVAAGEVGVEWQVALDEQFVQKVLPRVRGADGRLDEGLESFLQAVGDGFPLAREKTELMREDYATHGFASYF
jgi:MoxR-like ATPase